jgi:hypothetical protein
VAGTDQSSVADCPNEADRSLLDRLLHGPRYAEVNGRRFPVVQLEVPAYIEGPAAGQAASHAAGATLRVLGHHPEYLRVGEAIGAKAFDIPAKVWQGMSETAQWAANQRFLDRGISDGATIILATLRADIRAGSSLAKEVRYLLENGYKWAEDGLSMVPK